MRGDNDNKLDPSREGYLHPKNVCRSSYDRAKHIKNYFHGRTHSDKMLFGAKTDGLFVTISGGVCSNGELFNDIGYEYDVYLEFVAEENRYYVLDIDTQDSFATKLNRIRSAIVHPLIVCKEFSRVVPEFKEGVIIIVNYHVPNYEVFKWKRPEDQTVDLLVENSLISIDDFLIPTNCEDGIHEFYLATMKYKRPRLDKTEPNSSLTILSIRKAMSIKCLCTLHHGSCPLCTQKPISQEEFESLYLVTPVQDRYIVFSSYDLSNIDFEKVRLLVPSELVTPSEMTVTINEILSGGKFAVLDAIRYGFWYKNGKWIRETHSFRFLRNYWQTFMHYVPELGDFLGYNYLQVAPGIYYWGDIPVAKDFITIDLVSLTYVCVPVVDAYHTRNVMNFSINFGTVDGGTDLMVDLPVPMCSIEFDIVQFLTYEYYKLGMVKVLVKYAKFIKFFPVLYIEFRSKFVIRDKQHAHIMDAFKK